MGSVAERQDGTVIAGVELVCPRCSNCSIRRDGKTAAGKQRWRCKLCGRIFVVEKDGRISPLVKELADNLIKAGVAVPVLAQAFQGHASKRWLYHRRSVIRECR